MNAMNNRASIEEVLNVHLFNLSCHRVSDIVVVNLLIASNIYMSPKDEDTAEVCAGCYKRLIEPGLQTDQGRFGKCFYHH